MTDLREMFGTVLRDEPAACTIDPYAALADGRRRRVKRRGWAGAGTALAVVAAAVALVGLPRIGSTPTPGAVPSGSPEFGTAWIATAATVPNGLDPAATRAALTAAGIDVPRLLGLSAAAAATPYPADTAGGELQLAYRTAGSRPSEVRVVLQGPKGWIVPCPSDQQIPSTQWPAVAGPSGPALVGLLQCRASPLARKTTDSSDRTGWMVASVGAGGVGDGFLSVTISSPSGSPAPVTFSRALATLAALAGHLVFDPTPASTGVASATYDGPVRAIVRYPEFGLTLAPSKFAPVLTWQQAYQYCLRDGMCRTDMTVTIRSGLATSEYPATIHPDGTPFPSGSATPDIVDHPAYVLIGNEVAPNCPLPAGGTPMPPPGYPSPPATSSTCTTVVIMDSTSGQMLTATQVGRAGR
jgi:hypothetical protein